MAEPFKVLDGSNLTIGELVRIARDPTAIIGCDPIAMKRVVDAAALVSEAVENYKTALSNGCDPVLDYGITTGFGEFKRIPINPNRLEDLQKNILVSHAAGVGETLDEEDLANFFPCEVVRAVLVLRINAFLKGHSGVRPQIVRALEAMVNNRIIPLVPIRGSVGSSGDLAPLAHLFLWLCDDGREMLRFYQLSAEGKRGPIQEDSRRLPELLGLTSSEISPQAKEGLALTNGATFSAAMLALAVHDATSLVEAADAGAAMCAEALLGCARAFDEQVHDARGQLGQSASAANIRRLLENSQLLETASEVQDPYSIRCAPAVHGASRDTLEYVRAIVSREINAATDNPLLFGKGESWDWQFERNWARRSKVRLRFLTGVAEPEYDGRERRSYSAGNFHGQPVALAADFLAIAVAELADISERRTQVLMDSNHNRGLPANLVPDAGLNSGFMIAQYCAAGLVSENKVLAHPASVDSIPTSSNSEDHNSMATIAARKLRTVLANTRHTLAIELLVAAQALEWAALFDELNKEGPLREPVNVGEDYLASLRAEHNPDELEKARGDQEKRQMNMRRLWERGPAETVMFERWTSQDNRPRIAGKLGKGTATVYRRIRDSVGPMTKDRVLSHDIRRVAKELAPGANSTAALLMR